MRPFTGCAIALLLGVTALPAQDNTTMRLRPEIRPIAGVLIPLGDFRNEFVSAETLDRKSVV